MGLAQIFWDALPVLVAAAKGILRVSMALLGCLSIPLDGFCIVSGNEISPFKVASYAVLFLSILSAKLILRFNIALFCSLAIPLGCFSATRMREAKH